MKKTAFVRCPEKAVESFIAFLPTNSHGSSDLCDSIVNLFKDLQIDIANCRGQSYDNARNMAGRYSGLQARIKQFSPLAEYIPCAAHSLNLVGSVAVECCSQAITFFGFVQSLYNFFSASTHRWGILITKLSEFSEASNKSLTLKSLSQTRWSAHADATKALRKGHAAIKAALEVIAVDEGERSVTRHEAKCLASKLEELETAILIVVWDTILQRINKVSQSLQKVSSVMSIVVPLYDSLLKHVQDVRDNFSTYESEAFKLVGQTAKYSVGRKKKITKSKMLDESLNEGTSFSERESFIYKCHYVLCDSLLVELKRRKEAYANLDNRFGFLYKEYNTEFAAEITEAAKHFQDVYSIDIDDEFTAEFLQFKDLFTDSKPDEQLKILKRLGIEHTFPNVDTCLRIFLSMPISNCSGERCFSALKRIKNNYRSTLGQKKLNWLSLMCIEYDITVKLDFEDVISSFAEKKCSKKPLC